MSFQAVIKKKWGSFSLDINIESGGECLGILGPSGCGKSMALKCIAGIEKPDEGRILVDGRLLFDSERHINLPPQQRNIGYLFQNYALFPTMTVRQNIEAVLCGKKKEKCRTARELIKQFQLEGLEERRPFELSGGQQQRVALARMFAGKPGLLLLDEPFSAMDSFLKDAMMQHLKRILREFGRDAVLVSHNRDEVYYFCRHLVIMARGRVLTAGDTRRVFEAPGYREAAGLTGCKNISSIRRIDGYHFYAVEWDMTLTVREWIDDGIGFAGVRAHDIRPSPGPVGENTFPVEFTGVSEAPFEVHYLFRRAGSGQPVSLWWKKAKVEGRESMEACPAYMTLPAEAIMLLRG